MSGALPVRLHPAALEELVDTARWYEERAGLGGAFLAEAEVARTDLAAAPEACRVDPSEPGARRAPLRRFPYHLVFCQGERELLVLAVAHVRREPGYWRGRLSS